MRFNPEVDLYNYRAQLIKAVDGDTIRVKFDLGLKVKLEPEDIRLLNVDTPERGKPNYKEARAFTQSKLENKELIIETIKDEDEKYGRYLGKVYYKNEAGEWVYFNNELKNSGLLKPDSHWNIDEEGM